MTEDKHAVQIRRAWIKKLITRSEMLTLLRLGGSQPKKRTAEARPH